MPTCFTLLKFGRDYHCGLIGYQQTKPQAPTTSKVLSGEQPATLNHACLLFVVQKWHLADLNNQFPTPKADMNKVTILFTITFMVVNLILRGVILTVSVTNTRSLVINQDYR